MQDDAPLGAWLLGSVLATRRAEAEPALARALANPDERVAFEAAHALGTNGTAASRGALTAAARASASPVVRTAAGWAGDEIARRDGATGSAAGSGLEMRRETPLASSFRRGVSWWMGEGRQDHGAASFRRLAALGVTWVSLHTWDPLQRALDEPVFADPGGRHGFRDLEALVASAHAAGLRVMVKPHLEMRGFEAGEPERLVLRLRFGRAAVARRSHPGAARDRRALAAQPHRDAQRERLAALVRELPRLHPALRARSAAGPGRHVLRGP